MLVQEPSNSMEIRKQLRQDLILQYLVLEYYIWSGPRLAWDAL